MKENAEDIKIWLNTPQKFSMQNLAVTKNSGTISEQN